MNQTLPYAIIVSESIAEMVDIVNQAITQGYIPLGGISIIKNNYAQAIYNPTINNTNDRTSADTGA